MLLICHTYSRSFCNRKSLSIWWEEAKVINQESKWTTRSDKRNNVSKEKRQNNSKKEWWWGIQARPDLGLGDNLVWNPSDVIVCHMACQHHHPTNQPEWWKFLTGTYMFLVPTLITWIRFTCTTNSCIYIIYIFLQWHYKQTWQIFFKKFLNVQCPCNKSTPLLCSLAYVVWSINISSNIKTTTWTFFNCTDM